MKRNLLPALLLLLYLCPTAAFSQKQKKTPDPLLAGEEIAVTNTESGKVRGYIHNGIFTYKGIPYAKADRFMAPEKPTPWKDVRSSMAYGPVCPIDATTSVKMLPRIATTALAVTPTGLLMRIIYSSSKSSLPGPDTSMWKYAHHFMKGR